MVGLPTLHSILEKQGLSNKAQVDYRKLCKKLTIKDINGLFFEVFEHKVIGELGKLCAKDSSCWSRQFTTVVLDDSVFKMWLNDEKLLQSFDSCYGRFFSGQFGKVVYGVKILTLGIVIDKIFYPLYFDFVPKTTQKVGATSKTEAHSLTIARKLVRNWGELVKKAQQKGIAIPCLHFSCDSGYSSVELSNECQQQRLNYISVPKKSHQITYNEKKSSIKEFIETVYLTNEQKYNENKNLNIDNQPFMLRVRVKYESQNRWVTMLFFRYKDSKNVSVAYTTHKNDHAKTIRRHWFDRTAIEQFFKLLKHVFVIQSSQPTHKVDFLFKLLRLAFIAIHSQLLIKEIRKNKFAHFERKGFISLQRLLQNQSFIYDLLQKNFNLKS